MVNDANLRVFSQNISLEINLRVGTYGRWETPIVPEITSRSTIISEFTANLAGSYTFYVTNSRDTDVVAVRIQISAFGKFYK